MYSPTSITIAYNVRKLAARLRAYTKPLLSHKSTSLSCLWCNTRLWALPVNIPEGLSSISYCGMLLWDHMGMVMVGVIWGSSQKDLWAGNWNHVEDIFALIFKMMIESCGKFPHIATAQLSWRVQNCALIGSSVFAWEFLQGLEYEVRNFLRNGSSILYSALSVAYIY